MYICVQLKTKMTSKQIIELLADEISSQKLLYRDVCKGANLPKNSLIRMLRAGGDQKTKISTIEKVANYFNYTLTLTKTQNETQEI